MPSQRREFLKKAAATGTVVALAGCPGNGSGDGGDGTATMNPDLEYEEVEPISYLTLSRGDNPQYYQEAQQAQTMLEALGFSIDESVFESGQWVETLFAKDYDMANIGWSDTPERLFPYYNLFFSFHTQFTGEGGGNFSEFSSDAYDEAVENFTEAMELEQRQEYAVECQQLLAQNAPTAYMTNPPALIAHNNQLYSGWETMIGRFAYFNPISLMTATPEEGGNEMVYATVAPPEQFPNFMAHTGPVAVFLHKLNYDPLVQIDTEGNPVSQGAAEDWEVVDDTTIDVTLREGMTWHDGEPVTPEDVMFTWDYATEWGITYLASDIEPYESSEQVGDRTVRFNLSAPFAGFIPVSLYRLPILPQHVWDGITEEADIENPAQWQDPDMTGSGPFQMVNYEPGNQIVFEKHDGHYNADEYDIDTIVYQIYGTNSAAVGAMLNGNAAFTQGLGFSDWNRARDADNATATNNPSIRVNGLFMNMNREPYNDVHVRRAVAYAINREQIIETVHQGYGNPAKSPIARSNERYYAEDIEAYEFDLESARQQLFETGLRYDGDTLMKPVDWSPETEYVTLEE